MINMIRKGQVEKLERGAVTERVRFIAEIFGVATEPILFPGSFLFSASFCNTTLSSVSSLLTLVGEISSNFN